MQRSVNITFRGMDSSPAIEARIRDKIAWLERYYGRAIGCQVVVDAPHQHSRRGNLYVVNIELRVPGGPPIVVGRVRHDDQSHEDPFVAIRDAFAAARRRLQEHAEKRRGDVKQHEVPPHGRIAWTDPSERYGFIDAADGTEIYFHENALVDVAFDDLRPDDEVRYTVHPGEGAKGPQASTVHRVGKHHPVGPVG